MNMVKYVHVPLSDEEHEEFSKLKGSRTWKEVLVEGLQKEVDQLSGSPEPGEDAEKDE